MAELRAAGGIQLQAPVWINLSGWPRLLCFKLLIRHWSCEDYLIDGGFANKYRSGQLLCQNML